MTPADRSPGLAVERASDVAVLVEHDPAVRNIVGRQLALLGFVVHPFPDAVTALAWLERHAAHDHPRLVLSDVHMQGMSGYGLAAVLRRRFPWVPVVLMSGRADAGVVQVAPPGTAPVWVVGKPYELATLADAIGRAIRPGGRPDEAPAPDA